MARARAEVARPARADASRTPADGHRTGPEAPAPLTPESLRIRGCRRRADQEREQLATILYELLHPAMAALGLLFVVVVLAQPAARAGSGLRTALVVASVVLWAVFVVEFALRTFVAPSAATFLRRNWWQVLFLVVPALSLLRVFLVLRIARPTRVVLAAVRGTRSATNRLTARGAWLALVTAIVVFSAANLLYEAGDITPYGEALHAAAMAGIAGQEIAEESGLAQVLNVVLAVYAIAVFGALAGMVTAYFLEHRDEVAEETDAQALGRDVDRTG